MANFCGKCGRRTDPATGLCLVCNKPKINNQPVRVVPDNTPKDDFFADKPQKALKNKKSNNKKIIIIVAIITAICIFIGTGFAIMLSNNKNGRGATEGADFNYTSSYHTYESSIPANSTNTPENYIDIPDSFKNSSSNKASQESSNAILSPESAVDIYMANKNLWMENPEYAPMQGYGYCLLDLDFDGVLELISSNNDGSIRASTNRFFKINLKKLTVEEFQSPLVQDEKDAGGSIDYYAMAHESKLLKNTSSGKMFYLYKNYTRVSTDEGSCTWSESYMKNGKLYENYLFSEYWHPDYENNTNKEIREYRFNGRDVSKAVYEQKTKAYYAENKDLKLSWKTVYGEDFDNASTKTQKQLLLEAYRSFSYSGFSFDKVKTYDTNSNSTKNTALNIDPQAKEYALVEYKGMTVNNVAKIWGSDYTVMDSAINGGYGAIYYADKRCPFVFCFDLPNSSSRVSAPGGKEKLAGIVAFPDDNSRGFYVADGVKITNTYSLVSKRFSGGKLSSATMDDYKYMYNGVKRNGVYLSFFWYDNLETYPAEIVASFE